MACAYESPVSGECTAPAEARVYSGQPDLAYWSAWSCAFHVDHLRGECEGRTLMTAHVKWGAPS